MKYYIEENEQFNVRSNLNPSTSAYVEKLCGTISCACSLQFSHRLIKNISTENNIIHVINGDISDDSINAITDDIWYHQRQLQ